MRTVTERKKTPAGASMEAAARFIAWAVIVGCTIWTSLFLAWQLLSSVNFAYGLIYDWADIDATIAQYGPQNRYKRGLETTSRAERERIFAAIVEGINDRGEGLSAIRYHGPDGRDLGAFLRPPEVVHLQDVANLLERLRTWSYVAIGALALAAGLVRWRAWPRPSAKKVLLGVLVVGAVLSLAVAAYGPTEAFYYWHTLVFPDNHQWFFYYQESLMTTLMRAPVIFGYMALLLVGCAVCVLVALGWTLGRLLPCRRAPAGS